MGRRCQEEDPGGRSPGGRPQGEEPRRSPGGGAQEEEPRGRSPGGGPRGEEPRRKAPWEGAQEDPRELLLLSDVLIHTETQSLLTQQNEFYSFCNTHNSLPGQHAGRKAGPYSFCLTCIS
ncbi:hypothetical protein HispidOSU_027457 [Sigmodon hispidus]